ncbi:MAG: helix-turn-helix domain-containing protein, partial [Chlorobi bacterium]|nr:helix-turn-helix domain-containing protein [Chlorobiota bacterium]
MNQVYDKEERYTIAAYLNLAMSIREIARHSRPSPSTISRELRRNRS